MRKTATLIPFVFVHLSSRLARCARSFHALMIEGRLHSGSGCHGRNQQMRTISTAILLAIAATLAFATHAMAQGNGGLAQVVVLDECDPDTFNAALGRGRAGFCHNVALAAFGFATTLADLLSRAESGNPDPGWDFEPDHVTIKKGTVVSVVDQGGEPHTFTEVKAFGNGFLPPLNPGSATTVIPECDGGFRTCSRQDASRSRQPARRHRPVEREASIQCCIHPWMRMEVDVR